MAAASLHFRFRACVPKVGVVSGRRTALHGNIEDGASRPARMRHAFVSRNQARKHLEPLHHRLFNLQSIPRCEAFNISLPYCNLNFNLTPRITILALSLSFPPSTRQPSQVRGIVGGVGKDGRESSFNSVLWRAASRPHHRVFGGQRPCA